MNYIFKKNIWLHNAKIIGLSFNTVGLIVLFSLMSTVVELFGIGIFLPIFQFIRLEGDIDALVADSTIWQYLVNVFDYFSFEPSISILLSIAFFFFFGRQVFVYLRMVYIKAVVERLSQTQRNNLFDRYLESSTSYQDSIPVGNLTNIIMLEVGNAVSAAIGPVNLIVFAIMLTGYLCLLFILSWQMTIISVVVLFIASLASKVWIKKSTKTGRKLVQANTSMSEFLVGRLRSPRLVRLSGAESVEKKEFHSLTLSQRKHRILITILQAKTTITMEPIVIGLSLFFLYFSYTVLNLKIEEIGLYLVIALRLMPVLQSMIVQVQAIQGSIGSLEILEDRFNDLKESVEKDTGVESFNTFKQSILFSNVSYRYAKDLNDVLKDITINFKANEMTAVVGPSGGGKSTLIDLFPRLRLPTKGLMQVDGVNIEKYTLKSLRKMISYTPQSPQIFDGTVKNHILYGKPNATNSEIQEAVYLAGAKDFINQLPQGFDTVLGEDAVRLSGGQRQRLDLARALVSKSSILILDEPTSNLDAESEEKFNKALSRIRSNTDTTIIIVAHRLASISDADKIIVLNQGKVESSGVHSELLNQNGWYAKAWKMQLS